MKATVSPALYGRSETGRAGRRGSRSDLSRAVVESLELRTLLAADLTCGYVGAIPSALKLTGTNKVTVRLSNVGTTNATGTATVGLFLSTNTTLDAGDRALSPTVTRKVNLKPSAGLNIPVNFASPTGMPDGNYYLLADVTPSAGIGDTNPSNDAYASPGTVAVKGAFVDLTNSIATPIGGTITIGGKKPKPYNVSVVITNNGNVAAKGPLTENLYGSRDTTLSSSDVLIVTKPLGKVNIAAGKSKKYTLRVVPSSSSPSGTFYLLAHVNPNATVAESDLTNNVTASTGTFVVVNPAIPAGPQIVTDLGSTVSRVVVGSAELSTFTVTLDNAGDATAVEVDEFDSSGNSLGKLTDLRDNGSAANGDLASGDGVYTGINTIGFTAPGTRYFAAVVSDSSLNSPLKGATVSIGGANPLTPAQLQADATDASNLFHTADVVIQGGGSAASALSALKAALAADSNVVQSSVRQNSTAISWKNADGIPYLYDTSISFSGNTRGTVTAASPSLLNAGASPVVPLADNNEDATKTAIVLAPYKWNFTNWDESDPIAASFAGAGYTVTMHQDTTTDSTNVSLADFENLGQYDAVVITSHGGQIPGGGEDILTNVATSVLTDIFYLGDLWNDRLIESSVGGRPGVKVYAVAPSFIAAHTGSMNGSIVYVGACYSGVDGQMANAFINNGAAAYLGYTDSVGSAFAYNHGLAAFNTLLKPDHNTVGDIPGINVDIDMSDPAHPAGFVAYNSPGALNAILPGGLLLKNYDVYVQYNWPQNVRDLDTRTTFLGSAAGWRLGGGPYLNWGGDNTSGGGSETTLVDIYKAWADGKYTAVGGTTIGVGADWYTPAGGSGPAYVTVALVNKATGTLKKVVNQTISPGQQSSGASDTQLNLKISLGGALTDPTVKFEVVPA